MHDAFISYSRAESGEFVKRLAKALEDAGKDVWVDLDDIPPADRWQQALREGVLDSGVFLFVLSPGAVRWPTAAPSSTTPSSAISGSSR